MDAVMLLLMILFTFPMVSYIHEMAHFNSARLLGMQVKRVSLGTGKALSIWHSGQTRIEFNWNTFFGGFTELENETQQLRRKRVFFYLSGAIANIIFYLLGWQIYRVVLDTMGPSYLSNWVYLFVMINLYFAIVQLFPFRKGIKVRENFIGHPSDGMSLLLLFKRDAKETSKEMTNGKSKGRKNRK